MKLFIKKPYLFKELSFAMSFTISSDAYNQRDVAAIIVQKETNKDFLHIIYINVFQSHEWEDCIALILLILSFISTQI